MLGEFGLERRDQSPILIVDWALAAETVIVLRHLQHALARHVLAAQDVFQEGHYIGGTFGATERCNEYCIVVHGVSNCVDFDYFCSSARAASTSSLCLFGFTSV